MTFRDNYIVAILDRADRSVRAYIDWRKTFSDPSIYRDARPSILLIVFVLCVIGCTLWGHLMDQIRIPLWSAIQMLPSAMPYLTLRNWLQLIVVTSALIGFTLLADIGRLIGIGIRKSLKREV